MKKLIKILILCFSISFSYAQSPKSIDHALEILNENCSDSLKSKIRITESEELPNLFYPWNGENKTLMDFTSHEKKLRYQKYYEKLGIHYRQNIELITLTAFKRQLNGLPINHDSLVSHYKRIDQKWKYEDDNRFTIDSIRGVYIPKDIPECFKQIDSFWDDSTRTEVKTWSEDDFAARTHLGFGMWIRNNWQLWGGSRLSQSFHDKGIHHPDSMSWIILVSYHRYLNNKEIRLEDQFEPYEKDK